MLSTQQVVSLLVRLISVFRYSQLDLSTNKVLINLSPGGNRWGNSGNSVRLYFGGAPKSLQMVIAAMKLKDAYSLEGKL